MPLSVAFIRVFSVVMALIGVAELIISCIVLGASTGHNVGGIYFAATALFAGFWGLCMVEGVRQFNMLSLFLFMNIVCAIVGVVYAGIDSYVVDKIQACSEFDPAGHQMPRCSPEEGSYSNFTCSGNTNYYTEAAKCGTRFVHESGSSGKDCGCVYLDGGTHCKEFTGYENCDKMQELLPALSLGSYALGYACLSLSVFLLICSCTASCFHSQRRGLMSVTAEELRECDPGRQQQRGGILKGFRALRVRPAANGHEAPQPISRTVQMVRVQVGSPSEAEQGLLGGSPAKEDGTRSPAQAQSGRKRHKEQRQQQQQDGARERKVSDDGPSHRHQANNGNHHIPRSGKEQEPE